ncbi:hypothetical protein CKW46_23190 [Mycobacterium liflandii]|nr:hypothetical protein MMSP_4482 [Mycobacterium sp. 012931]MBC9864503.1 hypothetical protein [Mycobacterium pseudoshottsii]ULL11784.1 hypothetical protein CKW46_23190 [Mycobacterium liflandii]GAQ37897.1 hypothetical protein MPS_3906 [Mycobacterium pseudoshottsii JCM 15466]
MSGPSGIGVGRWFWPQMVTTMAVEMPALPRRSLVLHANCLGVLANMPVRAAGPVRVHRVGRPRW